MLKRLGIPDLNDFTLVKVEQGIAQDDVKKYLEGHVYSDDLKIPDDEGILYYENTLIGSRGNIVAINGRAKSRKSVIASAMMSSAFTAEGFLGFECRSEKDLKVLHFDTEQGYGDWLELCWRVIRDAGHKAKPPGFISHHSRDCMPEMRLELLRYALDLYRPDILVIDGVTDLVYDFNTNEETAKVGGELMVWSVKYNCMVVVVIHLTKGNGYMTGALGTFLEKKCQTAIKCEIDEDNDEISNISCQYARRKKFHPFGIQFNEKANQYERTDASGEITKSTPPAKATDELRARLLNQVFNLHTLYKGERDLRGGVYAAARLIGIARMNPADTTQWLKFWLDNQLIGVDPEGQYLRLERLEAARKASPRLDLNGPEYKRDTDLNGQENPVDDLPF